MKKIEGNDRPYQPVSCDTYSTLEIAIVRRQHVHLVWHQDNISFTHTLFPIDLETQGGEEYLHYRLPTGETGRIRLDRIDRVGPA